MFNKIVKTGLGVAGVIAAIIFINGILSDENLDLQVKAGSGMLQITNIGQKPTSIIDVVINDRLDCATTYDSFTGEEEALKAKMHAMYSAEALHKLWVRHLNPLTEGRLAPVAPGSTDLVRRGRAVKEFTSDDMKPKEIKIGETAQWEKTCGDAFVRATVTTENGSATYSFVRGN